MQRKNFEIDMTDEKLRNKILQTDVETMNDQNKFKDLYHFTFNFAKNPSQKSLELEDAIAYWKMILNDRFKYLDIWIQFLTVKIFFIKNLIQFIFF